MKLVISDIHNRVDWIEPFLAKQNYDKVIFLGDYFDQFHDSIIEVSKTARWLKESLQDPKRIHLLGNHDMSYMFPKNQNLYCPGFDDIKSKGINKVLSKEDWKKLKLVHFEDDYVFSHAGLHPRVFSHPIHGMTKDHIEKCCEKAIEKSKSNEYSQYLEWGWRMGRQLLGGCIWLEWDEFEPSEIKQIVGHTPSNSVREKNGNFCMDTNNRHIGILDGGKEIKFLTI